MTKALTTGARIDLDEDAEQDRTVLAPSKSIVNEDDGKADDIIDEDAGDLDKVPKRAIANGDGSFTLPLLEQVTITTKKDGKIRERVYDSLTFRRLKGADIQAIAATSKESETVVTFARATGLNQAVMNAVFDRLDAADIVDGGRIINHFLTSGRRTGR